MALELIAPIAASTAVHLPSLLGAFPVALAAAVVIDLIAGDPVYPLHPVRLMGHSLSAIENLLRRAGADGYIGGIILFLLLTAIWVGGISLAIILITAASFTVAGILHLFLLYSLLAQGDMLRHVWRVERAVERGDLAAAHLAVSHLVGRDTTMMDGPACRRAAIESLSESLTDGFISPVFWYAIAGLPGIVLFKIVSTMDSMVGYKTPRYLRFGWCGARLDDVMNYVPARLAWLLIAAVAAVTPACSAVKAFRIGLQQHAVLPGPNSGWSEAATAGAIQARIVGPIYLRGEMVTDVWIGDPNDPPAALHDDVVRASTVVTATAIVTTLVACAGLFLAVR